MSKQRLLLLSLLVGSLLGSVACSSVRGTTANLTNPETLFGLIEPHRIEIVQGNVVTKEYMALIKPGMSKAQVRDVLGAPVLTNIFHINRWDYIFTIAKQGVDAQQRRVSLFFKNDLLERVDADGLPTEKEFVASVERDTKAVVNNNPDLTAAQLAALPLPAKNTLVRKAPQGAVREYPPLEAANP